MSKCRHTPTGISRIIVAGMFAGLGVYSHAADFSLQNNQLTITGGGDSSGFSATPAISSDGIVGVVNNVPTSDGVGIPNFSFTLISGAVPDGTYSFRVGVTIDDDNTQRRVEAVIHQLNLVVTGGDIDGTIPAGQDLNLLAQNGDGSLTVNANVTNESQNGPVEINDGTITFNAERLIERIRDKHPQFDTIILEEFDDPAHYTYRIVAQQTGGPELLRFGTGPTFEPFPRIQSVCADDTASQTSNVFTINSSQFSNFFTSAYAVQGQFNVVGATPGAGLPPPTPFSEDCGGDVPPPDPDVEEQEVIDAITDAFGDDTEVEVDEDDRIQVTIGDDVFVGEIMEVADAPAGAPNGLTTLPDGRVVITGNGKAITIAPAASVPEGFSDAVLDAVAANVEMGPRGGFTLDLGDILFSATFGFQNVNPDAAEGEPGGNVTISWPEGDPNDPSHAFTVTFADGVVQRIVPFAYEPGFYDSLAAMGFAVTTDRFTGVVTLDGGPLSFKPSFYVMPLTAADEDFLNANADSRGLAYRPGDVNGDGILDYTVLSGEGAQVMYGL